MLQRERIVQMSLEEVFSENPAVTRKEAISEYRQHGLDEAELVDDLGDKEEYSGADVLLALGY